MHARELIELAAVIAAQSRTFLGQRCQMPDGGIQQYWAASRCRHQRWFTALKDWHDPVRCPTELPHAALWPRLQPLAEEILTGEVLTRVWAGISAACDHHNRCSETEPIARSVLIGQLEARYRVLNLVIKGQQQQIPQAESLNRLRSASERWTDLLLGYFATDYDVAHLAFDPGRMRRFAGDLKRGRNDPHSPYAWRAVRASIRSSLHEQLSDHCPNGDLNRRIAAGIMICFPAELSDSESLLGSVWIDRLTHTASNTQGMIDELLSLDSHPLRST